MKGQTSRILVAIGIVLFALSIAPGCSTSGTPSPVHTDIARVQAHVQEAQAHADVLEKQNNQAAVLAQRIHDKDVLIDRWNETHRAK